jgi:hypothetical protein
MEMYLNDETISRMAEAYGECGTEKALKRCLRSCGQAGSGITACYLRSVEQDTWETLVGASVEEALEIYRSMGEAGKIILANAVLSRRFDSRLYKTVQDWAADLLNGQEPVFRTPLHSCHLNKVVLDLFVAPGKNCLAYL